MELRKLAENFNEQYFGNSIRVSEITFKTSKRMTRALGYFSFDRRTKEKTIKISHYILEDKKELEDTIIHEMIHAWQNQLFGKADHGSTFKKMAIDIKRKSRGAYDITTRVNSSQLSENVASKLVEKKIKKLRNQYMIIRKNGSFNFMRSLTPSEIQYLKKRGFEVKKLDKPIIGVKHCKNFTYLMRWQSYYPAKCFSRIM